MSLAERISADLTAAMKAKEGARLDALRAAKTALTLREVEAKGALADAEAAKVIEALVKQRREAVEMFCKGGREDLAAADEAQIAALKAYLPAAVPREKILEAIDAPIAETAAGSPGKRGSS